jgi:hypothetical protein
LLDSFPFFLYLFLSFASIFRIWTLYGRLSGFGAVDLRTGVEGEKP